jgi:hypothetical protein
MYVPSFNRAVYAIGGNLASRFRRKARR